MENQAKIYPEDSITGNAELDIIDPSEVHTLDEMFRERVRRCGDKIAYTQFDPVGNAWVNYSWGQIAGEVERWQVLLQSEGLQKGDRVAVRLVNSIEWVIFDQAALRLGLVVVPLYCADRADNVNYVLNNSGAKLLLLDSEEEWLEIRDADAELPELQRVLLLSVGNSEAADGSDLADGSEPADAIVRQLRDVLPKDGQHLERGMAQPEDLASIVYTSGTTGRPKGVMLSHQNMLHNAYAGMRSVPLYPNDRSLSFLPLSHTFERTIGYYASMMCAAHVVYNRSIPDLVEDLAYAKPTYLIAVPRIFERVSNKIYAGVAESSAVKQKLFALALDIGWRHFEYTQGRQKWSPVFLLHPLLDSLVGKKVRSRLGGNLRFAVVGGAPLAPAVAKTFIGLGVFLLQGYGLTESSPVISVNTPEHNKPETIGLPLRGVELCIGENDELLSRGSNVMMGYWQNPEATAEVLTEDGWLRTGDQASLDEEGYIRITGRLKDILVLANGEKVPPADMESAILKDELFDQVMVIGEGKPFLSALMVLNRDALAKLVEANVPQASDVQSAEFHELVLARIAKQIEDFPGYARIRKVSVSVDEWTVDDGLVTPTLKIMRPKVQRRFADEVAALYEGH